MTSLPISNNKPQPAGSAANALPTNTAADGLATNVQPAEPFAFLLAQQIGKTDLPAPDAIQTTTIDGISTDSRVKHALKDAQDQAATPINPSDPTNTVSAIMLQLPAPEDKAPLTEGNLQHLASSREVDSRHAPFTPIPSQNTAEDKQIIQHPFIDHLPSEASKRVESLSGLTQPTSNTAQAIASSAIPAAMSTNMLANNISASTSPIIATPVGSDGWADEFSQKITWMSTQQNQVAELHLNPPNLGPLDVVLKISDNQATALFASPHGAVRDAVENALPKLREILADNGIMLGNTTISDQPPRDRSMDEFLNQGSGAAVRHEASSVTSEPAGLPPAVTQTMPARRHHGMVDTFV